MYHQRQDKGSAGKFELMMRWLARTQASMFDKGVTLYTAGTPNGWKANMIVEELKIPYKLHTVIL